MKKVKEVILEKSLYPIVERWLKKYHLCFKTAKDKTLKISKRSGEGKVYGRIDVVGIKDVGGDLSGEVETIAVEVKKGSEPFARACGQALGYKVSANRVYLSDLRDKPFTPDEIRVASHLGIGLVQIQNGACKEILSSPYYKAISKLNLSLLEDLALGKCQLCDSLFEIGDIEKNTFSHLAREDLKKAIKEKKGLMFWNREVATRKDKLGIRKTKNGTTYERRFICPDCISNFIAQLKNGK